MYIGDTFLIQSFVETCFLMIHDLHLMIADVEVVLRVLVAGILYNLGYGKLEAQKYVDAEKYPIFVDIWSSWLACSPTERQCISLLQRLKMDAGPLNCACKEERGKQKGCTILEEE